MSYTEKRKTDESCTHVYECDQANEIKFPDQESLPYLMVWFNAEVADFIR